MQNTVRAKSRFLLGHCNSDIYYYFDRTRITENIDSKPEQNIVNRLPRII